MSHPDFPPERPRLPDTSFPATGGGEPIPLRMRRRGTVLVLLPARPDEAALGYLGALAAHEPALRDWDGRVVVVVPEAGTLVPEVAFPVAVDAAGRIAAIAGVEAPALVVTDQWGEVHVAERRWLPPDEVEQWLRMLAIRCAG